MSRIVVTTAGSLGDLHPYLAVALGMQARGHEVTVATSLCYRDRIESAGLGFRPVRPDADWLADPDRVRRLGHPRRGLVRVGREWLMPALRDSYDDTLAAAEGADLLVGMLATYATRLVAETTGIPWVSAVHIPLGFYSAYDPPVLDVAPFVTKSLRPLGPAFWRPFFWCGKRASRFLAKPWYRLRAELGLPPTSEGNPLVDSHSPRLVLALFSRLLAEPQPDWPPRTIVTGFPLYVTDDEEVLSPELHGFLDDGPPPIVFTLGSAVAGDPGSFYDVSAKCTELLGRRAVFVVGHGNRERIPTLSSQAIGVEYAPFHVLFPRAAVVVHHGGVGTTGLAMRAGRPMLFVPVAWDQPDNAALAARLGIARTIPKRRYTAARAAAELRKLLDRPEYGERALAIAEMMQHEDGVATACDALEKVLHQQPSARRP